VLLYLPWAHATADRFWFWSCSTVVETLKLWIAWHPLLLILLWCTPCWLVYLVDLVINMLNVELNIFLIFNVHIIEEFWAGRIEIWSSIFTIVDHLFWTTLLWEYRASCLGLSSNISWIRRCFHFNTCQIRACLITSCLSLRGLVVLEMSAVNCEGISKLVFLRE